MTNEYPEGMSLRDWFAGMAMQGLVSSGGYVIEYLAEDAYAIADKMIAERIKFHNTDD